MFKAVQLSLNNMNIKTKYKAIIGLEVHAQLLTNTKAYSSDENIYGAIPNTKTSPISLGHPGTLPSINKKVIEYAVRLGVAIGSDIRQNNEYARKNYFYADLPKGYQITQDKTPICTGGSIVINFGKKNKKSINITRIHMEEDAGKSIHDIDPFNTLIDLNRAGVPLLEIVSEPELNSSEEAYEYLNEIRKILRYLNICNGNMEEGSLRCDANISVMLSDDNKFGTKVEVKNMNSMRNVKKAIDFEINRQINLIEQNDIVISETRSFNAADGTTIPMRRKEEANDYRYFPEPDILPVIITKEYIKKINDTLPLLPEQLYVKFTNNYNLSSYDASVLIEDKEIALYFDELCSYSKNYKISANIINGIVKSYLNENAISIKSIAITPKRLAGLIKLISSNEISNTVANSKLFPLMLKNKESAKELAEQHNLKQEKNNDAVLDYINKVILKYPDKVEEYKNGKLGLFGLFMGEIMKISKGKVDPKITTRLLKDRLKQ